MDINMIHIRLEGAYQLHHFHSHSPKTVVCNHVVVICLLMATCPSLAGSRLSLLMYLCHVGHYLGQYHFLASFVSDP
jgi:hypothetical protein